MDDPIRCGWCLSSDLYKEYHDQEWGTPVYDDATLFEFLILETFQAGLSWITILNKGRISGKRLTISTIKNSPLFRRQDPSPLLDAGIIRDKLKSKGKLARYFKGNTLVNQDYIKDNKLSVANCVKSLDKHLMVNEFKRAQLG
jgi:hypothetical protein